ncbi:hypothetical protein HQ447_17460 [bacterium]|nr:hypothetical protein [bacterium]
MRILLDTNMCIYIMNRRPVHVVEFFQHSLKLPLVTNNTAEFERVPNLTLENWAEPS